MSPPKRNSKGQLQKMLTKQRAQLYNTAILTSLALLAKIQTRLSFMNCCDIFQLVEPVPIDNNVVNPRLFCTMSDEGGRHYSMTGWFPTGGIWITA